MSRWPMKREKYNLARISAVTLEALRDVTASEYKGPRAVFSEVHVLKALLAIGEEGSVGRGRLGSLVGLGQGEVRTLIKRLKENGLIVIEHDGSRLSKKGEKEFQKLKAMVPWSAGVPAKTLGIGDHCVGVLVRGVEKSVRKGIEQRDAAVRAGAQGAFTSLFSHGHFTLPEDGSNCEKAGPPDLWSAVRGARPVEGDVLIVVGAESAAAADLGTIAAALTLL